MRVMIIFEDADSNPLPPAKLYLMRECIAGADVDGTSPKLSGRGKERGFELEDELRVFISLSVKNA